MNPAFVFWIVPYSAEIRKKNPNKKEAEKELVPR